MNDSVYSTCKVQLVTHNCTNTILCENRKIELSRSPGEVNVQYRILYTWCSTVLYPSKGALSMLSVPKSVKKRSATIWVYANHKFDAISEGIRGTVCRPKEVQHFRGRKLGSNCKCASGAQFRRTQIGSSHIL